MMVVTLILDVSKQTCSALKHTTLYSQVTYVIELPRLACNHVLELCEVHLNVTMNRSAYLAWVYCVYVPSSVHVYACINLFLVFKVELSIIV